GSGHPSYRKMQTELEVRENLLAKRKAAAEPRVALLAKQQQRQQQVQAMRGGGGTALDVDTLRSRVEVLKNQEQMLQERVDQLSGEMRQLGQSSIDVELMRAEIASLEDVRRRVGEEIERTAIELKTDSRIKLLSPAVAAAPPDTKKRMMRMAALGMFGLLAPIGLMVIWDMTRKRVNNVESVSRTLSLPTIGTIPLVAKNPLQRGPQGTGGRSHRRQAELDEAVDGLASMLLHSAQIDDNQVFMLSSAMPGEGKSTVACQLSLSLARSGKKVALVDFDLRRPSVHRYLDLPLQPGVAETLHHQVTLADALQPGGEPKNLKVLTAGQWSGQLHERCTDGAVDDLFEELRANYDLVIVDSSPVLPVHDARVIGKYTDGVILTLVRDRSRLPLVASAYEIFKSYGIPVLGTVMIGGSAAGYTGYYHAYGEEPQSKRLMSAK
ncbi:MAG: P-loop NTPase, partial [Planctomycetales bacterium]|nr:P-loop NTPase [Planctomycetales bacterium]